VTLDAAYDVDDPCPPMPAPGEVVADLPTLKRNLGAKTSTDDANLTVALSAATEWVYERAMECEWCHPDVQLAILLLAARLYQRRKTPEGVAGFGTETYIARFVSDDPDVARLLTRHLDMRNVGIG